jgi:hypothetical protein
MAEKVSPKPRDALAPVSFCIASPACLAMMVGGVAQWATAWGFVSLSGTRFHGWSEVALGFLGFVMLTLHLLRGARFALLVAAGAGALGALQAIVTLAKLSADGAVTVFGVAYRYVDPSWGLYLVLAGAIVLASSTTATWLATSGVRPPGRRSRRRSPRPPAATRVPRP